MAAAYATLVSALNIINNLHHHPRPPISLPIQQVESLTHKISFLLEFLQGYNPHRDYSKEVDPLERRIADAAYAAEYAIESHIFNQLTNNGENIVHLSAYDGLYEALEKVVEDMAAIEEEAEQIQGRVEVQHQLPPDSLRSSEIPQQSSMVGADDAKLQMMDKLTSDLLHLQIIPIVGMGGSVRGSLGALACWKSSSSSELSIKVFVREGTSWDVLHDDVDFPPLGDVERPLGLKDDRWLFVEAKASDSGQLMVVYRRVQETRYLRLSRTHAWYFLWRGGEGERRR